MFQEESTLPITPSPIDQDHLAEIISVVGVLGIVGYIIYSDWNKPKLPPIPMRRRPVVIRERSIIREKAPDDDGGYFIDSRDHTIKHTFKKKPTTIAKLDDEYDNL